MLLKPTCKEIISSIASKLVQMNWTLATAESCTGGLIGSRLTDTPGASQWYRGGVIAYHNMVKESLLKVPLSTIETKGAVSEDTVKCMSIGVCTLLASQCSIAVSGIAGPGGGTNEKPVGLVYLGIGVNSHTKAYRHIFKGSRREIKLQALHKGLYYLDNLLKNHY